MNAHVESFPLRLEGVTRSFSQGERRLDVLRGVDLTLRRGETVALAAPSGAGKSTLLQIAGLLEPPDSGEVHIGESACGRLSEAERTRMRRTQIGFVYQFHHLLPEFSALENVMLPQLIRGLRRSEAKARAVELLTWLGLDGRLEHRPAELSGGEQQRVAIGRAVANAPRVLLADEPTGNLDPATADLVFDSLLAITKSSGMAALIATHNLDLAARMDRRITLKEGKLTELA